MSEVLQHIRRIALLPSGAGLTDGQLLGCFVEHRDDAAFAALVRRHGPMVWGVCSRLLNPHDAEDAFQATFLVLVRKAGSIASRERVANWLYGVAHQTALQARRNAARRMAREKQVKEMPDPAEPEQELWRDLQPLLDQELSRLPNSYREMIILCDLEGKTRREVARQLGLPEGTVGSRLARARKMLAKRLARLGLAVSGGTLIGVLSQKASSASVPTSVVSSTIKAATPVAAGQAAAGLISVKAAILTEGVLKAMTTTKIKTVLLAFLVVAIAGMGLGGVFYKTQAVEPRAVLPVKKDKNIHADQPALPGDKHGEQLEKLKSEVEQLRADNKELKKRLQKQIRKGSSTDVKLVTLVLPLSALTSLIGPALPDQSEAKPLIRVITRTIEPASWSDMGGDGSIEYLSAWGSLVVRQSPAIVEQVEQLLQNLLDNKEELEKQKKK